ncbi:MAG: hypothetical protein ACYTDW_20270 [Planctomycetota bacterium]|jgi:hypothetical protein
MKESPQDRKLEELLRSSRLVAGGFMGYDTRNVSEVIDADAAELSRLGFTKDQVAERMRQITQVAISGLGTWVQVGEGLEGKVDEAKGRLICPWPHKGKLAKRITVVKVIKTGESIRWSDLNFRIEPRELVQIIF